MRSLYHGAALLALLTAMGASNVQAAESTLDVTLNGLHISLDAQTGGVVKLSYDGPGTLLETDREGAGLIDLAYPVPTFEPLRLATRFSRGAEISHLGNSLTISWPRLGATRADHCRFW